MDEQLINNIMDYTLLAENVSNERELLASGSSWLVITYGSFIAVLGSILFTVIIVLVLTSNRRHMQLNRQLQVCLSVLHMTSFVVVVPAEIARECLGGWSLGDVSCRVWLVINQMLVPMTLWTIFCLVLSTLQEHVSRACCYSSAQSSVTSASILTSATIITATPLVSAIFYANDLLLTDVCAVLVDAHYTMTSSLVGYFLPASAVIIILFILALGSCTRSQSRDVSYLQHAGTQPRIVTTTIQASGHVQRVNQSDARFRNACVTLTAYSSVYIICWAPFYTTNVWLSVGRCRDDVCFNAGVWTLLQWFGYSSSLLVGCCFFISADLQDALNRWLNAEHVTYRTPSIGGSTLNT